MVKAPKVITLMQPQDVVAFTESPEIMMDNHQIVQIYYSTPSDNPGGSGCNRDLMVRNASGQIRRIRRDSDNHFNTGFRSWTVTAAEVRKLGFDRVYFQIAETGGTGRVCVFALLMNERYAD